MYINENNKCLGHYRHVSDIILNRDAEIGDYAYLHTIDAFKDKWRITFVFNGRSWGAVNVEADVDE